jgi:hypothetical protein
MTPSATLETSILRIDVESHARALRLTPGARRGIVER